MPLHPYSGWLVAAGLGLAASAGIHAGQAPQATGPPTGNALLAGRVVEAGSARPIAGAVVSLIGPVGPMRPVATDSQGRFFFANLPAGTYQATASKAGHAPPAQVARPISLSAAQRLTDLKVRLARVGSIAGAVRDDAGDPVVGAGVMVFRRAMAGGRARLQRVTQVRTDDRGEYRAFNLRAGDYLVCACARDPIPFDGVLLTTLASEPAQLFGLAARALQVGADVAGLDATLRTNPPTFHPSSTSAAQAARIVVSPGADVSGIDINVTAVRAVRVSGTVVGAPGPLDAASLRLVPAGESADEAGLWALAPMLAQPDGRFDFSGVPPGQYLLRVTYTERSGSAGGPSGAALAFLGARASGMGTGGAAVPEAPPYWAAEPVAVGEADIRGLTVTVRRGPRVSGRVEFTGNAPPPAPQMLARASVVVQSLTPNPTYTGWTPTGRLTADGQFTIAAVVPGRHVILTSGVLSALSLKSITAAGEDITDLPIEIAASDVTDIVLTFTSAPMPSLRGTVSSSSSDDEDVSVLVFPADRRYWADPAAARRRFRAVAVRPDGTFMAPALPAGDYLLAVVADEATLDWQDAPRLELLARTALSVTLADGDRRTVEVRR